MTAGARGKSRSSRPNRSEQTRPLLWVDVDDLDLTSADWAGFASAVYRRAQAGDRPSHLPPVYPAGDAAAPG